MKTLVLSGEDNSAVAKAIESLQSGDIVGLPTETVYGLAADALSVNAVLRIFETKERPRFDPLIVHLPEREWLERVANVPVIEREIVDRLIGTFWPGPLTLVLPRRSIIPDVVTAGLETVAIRISANPIFDRIVRGLGRPLAAPSANRFGRISPTTAAHVLGELEGRIPLIVDGGPTKHGLESTIVAVRGGHIEILRHGPITAEQLVTFGEIAEAKHRDHPESPGQLPSHYAPQTPLQLTSDLAAIVPAAGKRLAALVLQVPTAGKFAACRVLSPTGNLREAAANLFRCLRELDDLGLDLIVAEAIPEVGLGVAIMDRLRRAASR